MATVKLSDKQVNALKVIAEAPRSWSTLPYGVAMNTINSLIKCNLIVKNNGLWVITKDGMLIAQANGITPTTPVTPEAETPAAPELSETEIIALMILRDTPMLATALVAMTENSNIVVDLYLNDYIVKHGADWHINFKGREALNQAGV